MIEISTEYFDCLIAVRANVEMLLDGTWGNEAHLRGRLRELLEEMEVIKQRDYGHTINKST